MTSWFFLEMAAKSALICSLALLLAMALKHRAAADRATVLRVGAGLLLALPLIDLAFPVLEIEAFAAPAAPALAELSAAELQALMVYAESLPPVAPTIWDDPSPLIMILWGAGALAVLLRLFVGLSTLNRWTRGAEPVTDPHWLAALERARAASGASDRLRLMVADKVPGPLGWGWRNPVVLIDYDTYAEPEEADAILAHEVAHVARRDWPALMMTRLATALFWFNPLVWTLARESVHQAEEAADAHAARAVEPTRYAETLLSWGQIGRGIAVPANSIAPGGRALSRRVRAVLDTRLVERSARSRIAVVAVLLCVGVAGPVAALELVEAKQAAAPAEPVAPLAVAAVAQPQAPRSPALPPEPELVRTPEEPEAPDAPDAPEAPEVVDVDIDIAPATEALRVVLPRIPAIVAHSLKGLDRDAMMRVMESVRVEHLSHEALKGLEHARRAMPNLEAMRVHVRNMDPKQVEVRLRALPDQVQIERDIRRSLGATGRGLEEGARGMERGAAQMEANARRFRNARERVRIIERERERGRTVTHEDLLDAAEGLEDGARGMREGAEQMRRSGRHMDDHD
jgi:beta-lactamase regulating signal transducer with metallopeptidase domain